MVINEKSTGEWDYKLIDEESNGGIGFCWESQAHGRGIYRRTGVSPGNISSWTLIQNNKIIKHEKSSKRLQLQDQSF
jgi:hypothetical protein